jgi:hypothetical protein
MISRTQNCLKYKKHLIFVDYDEDIESIENNVYRLQFVAKHITSEFPYIVLVALSKIALHIKNGMVYCEKITDIIKSLCT